MIALVCAFFGLILLYLDQITKAWAEATDVSQTVIPNFIRFRFTQNSGMAFGIGSDNQTFMVVVTVLTVVMIVGIAVLSFTLFKKNAPAQVALALVEAGAIGNLIDRLILDYVRDFVDVSSIGFGVCNLADFYITGGAVLLVIVILFVGKDAVIPLGKYRKQAKEEREKEKAEKQANG